MLARFLRTTTLAAAFAASGLAAAAAVITEDDAEFSHHWKSPTEIAFGADTILGTAEKQNARDFIALTLLPGAQTLTFEFTAPDWALSSDSYSAGGQVLWSDESFRHAWDGAHAGTFQLGRWTPSQTVDVVLGDDFTGRLNLGIYFTHGRDVAWSLNAPGNAAPVAAALEPAVVPLPAGLWLMLGGIGLLSAFGLRKKA